MAYVYIAFALINGLIAIAIPWAWMLGYQIPVPDAALLVWCLHLILTVGGFAAANLEMNSERH